MLFKKVLLSLFILFPLFQLSMARTTRASELQLTPVIAQVLSEPITPVLGSDGEYHLVYEIQLTNVSSEAWKVESVKALNQTHALGELKGAELQGRMGPLGKRGGSTDLGPSQTAFLWVHWKVRSKDLLPQTIQHQFNLNGSGKNLEVHAAEAKVSPETTVKIGPPLKGERWIAADGCCDSVRHVRALLPVNGRLYSAQRFAIDWEKLNAENKIFLGDAKNPENYFCYGQEVLAVADGVVLSLLDGLSNQVPGKLPEHIDIREADGNHIILQLPNGVYALYAHLKPGSIRVKVGERVRKGQVLAQVGNTGNTSEPHLHFHLMDGPSALASNGLPYLMESFEILGRAPSTAAFDKAAAEGGALAVGETKSPTSHSNQLPLDLSVLRFPQN